MTRAALLLAAVLVAAAPASAARWQVDPAKSRLGFTATWLGKAVPGRFARWTAAIDFDPANLAAARIVVDVDTRSAVTGDATVDGALPGSDWFDTGAAPRARFTSTSVAATGAGRYAARGDLVIRGKARPVTLDFTLAIAGNTATANGSVLLDRRWFAMGVESDASAAYVAFAVPVKAALVARRVN